MSEFKKILVPVDLSDVSPKLVPYVITMAEKFDSEIHLLFVTRIFQHFKSTYVPLTSIYTFERELAEGAEKKLQEFKEENFQKYPNVKITVVTGYIPEEILKYIETERINLVIMGTHGRKGLDKVFFGSVADRVIQSSPVPVLLVNTFKFE